MRKSWVVNSSWSLGRCKLQNSRICDRFAHLEDARVDVVETKEVLVEALNDIGTSEIPRVLYCECQ
jgi:hypothetical protein